MKRSIFFYILFILCIIGLIVVMIFLQKRQSQSAAHLLQPQIEKKVEVSKEEPKSDSEDKAKNIKLSEEPKINLPPSIEGIQVSGYEGKYGGYEPMMKAVEKVEVSIPTSVRILVDNKLPYPTGEDRIIIKLVDRKTLDKNTIYYISTNMDGTIEIGLDAQSVAFNALPIYEHISSAILEGLLEKREKTFLKLPKFLRLGFAVSLTGLNQYVDGMEILKMEKNNEKSDFSLISDGSHPLLNGSLLIKFLIDKADVNSPYELLSQFLKGENYPSTLEKVTLTDFSSLVTEYERFCKNYVEKMSEQSPHFFSIISELKQLKEEEAISKLESFVRQYPLDIHYGETLYYLGWANYRLGNYKEAENIFINLLNNYSFVTISHGKAHYFLGRTYELRGFKTLAYFEYKFANIEDNELLRKVTSNKMSEFER
jgi:tetratricopeptide (TPR) repeat protein